MFLTEVEPKKVNCICSDFAFAYFYILAVLMVEHHTTGFVEVSALSMTSVAVNDSGGQAQAVGDMFAMMDSNVDGELLPHQVQVAHEMIRMGGISLAQVGKNNSLVYM